MKTSSLINGMRIIIHNVYHGHLKASGGGQTAIVCAVSGVGGGDHGVDQVIQLEAGPGEGDLPPGAGDLAHGVSDGLQRRVLRLK